jgi:hypothetical protein
MENEKQEEDEKAKKGRLCPFMSTADNVVLCTSQCMLWRRGKEKGYECGLIEVSQISYAIRKPMEKKNSSVARYKNFSQ